MNEVAQGLRHPNHLISWGGPDGIMAKGAKEIDRLETELVETRTARDNWWHQVNKLRDELAEVKVACSRCQTRDDIDRLEIEVASRTADNTRLKRANKRMAERSGRLETDNNKLKAELDAVRRSRDIYQDDIDRQRNQLSAQAAVTVRELKAEHVKGIAILKAELGKVRAYKERFQTERDKAEFELGKATATLNATRAEVDRQFAGRHKAEVQLAEAKKALQVQHEAAVTGKPAEPVTHCRDCAKRPTCPTMTSCKSRDCTDCSNPGPCDGVYCPRFEPKPAKPLTLCRDCAKKPTCPTVRSCKSHNCSDCSIPGPCDAIYCDRFESKPAKQPSPSPALVKAAEEVAELIWQTSLAWADRPPAMVEKILALCAAMEDKQ